MAYLGSTSGCDVARTKFVWGLRIAVWWSRCQNDSWVGRLMNLDNEIAEDYFEDKGGHLKNLRQEK